MWITQSLQRFLTLALNASLLDIMLILLLRQDVRCSTFAKIALMALTPSCAPMEPSSTSSTLSVTGGTTLTVPQLRTSISSMSLLDRMAQTNMVLVMVVHYQVLTVHLELMAMVTEVMEMVMDKIVIMVMEMEG